MKFLMLILSLAIINIAGQDVVINEFMANNSSTIQDSDGDHSDWIELYNTSNNAVNLMNYSISDDTSNLSKWMFPAVIIPPFDYILIFASSKNSLNISQLHTNFKISSSGESLFLSNNSGVIIDQSISVALSADESYGRIADGNINWSEMNTPTPTFSNNNYNYLTFSNQEGFYVNPFSLKINSLLTDTIYYTLNGEVPNDNSYIFTDSISIDNKNSQPNILSVIPTTPDQNLISYKAWEEPNKIIDKATILRCASYSNGIRTSNIYTKTFFVDSLVNVKYTLPIISLITDERNLFDADSGIYVPGINFDMNNPEWSGNYFMYGEEWERNVHIEYFEPDGSLGFSQDAGMRIHGGKTRQASQKSLRLYARSEYNQSFFNYKLLPQKQITQYKRFTLRTSMGTWAGETIIKDDLAQEISTSLNIDTQGSQPALVFINGEYWGIHSIKDRLDNRYIEYTHGIDKDSVEFKEYGNVSFGNLMNFIENNDLGSNSNYEYVKTKIDIDNYIDYTIAELFFKNQDWPGNNMKFWRSLPDGKWRWIFYDLDAGFGDSNFNMFNYATNEDLDGTLPNPAYATSLFRNLLKNNLFKSKFLDRYAILLHTVYNIETTNGKLDSIKELYRTEIDPHIERWNYPSSSKTWNDDIDEEISLFLERRPCVVSNQILKFFDLTQYHHACDIQNNDALMIIAPNPNDGIFFLFNNKTDMSNTTFTITNITGQIVYKEDNINFIQNERKLFDISDFSKSTYILSVTSNEYKGQKKIIKIN